MISVFHVTTTGSDIADGSEYRPFRTINRAASVAQAGDTVVVHEGVYREWVDPRRGGRSDHRRITYVAAPGEHVVIKGSERVTGWEPVDGTVWKVTVPNSLFGSFNPFAEEIDGDWIVYPRADSPKKHLGDVYLNGLSFYEAPNLSGVSDPPLRQEAIDNWTGIAGRIRGPEQTRYVWYAEVGDDQTTIWANFQGADPNAQLVEINVRRSVFAPAEHHIDYITVRGFELAQAASPWAPPTADQPGLIGPNWAKGWIIEDNVIHDAKCSAISIGKEASTGHNYSTTRGDKPGYQYQLESVFSARQIGWEREHIGSHIIRRNTIFDIVGHLGCIFSTIEDNHICNIALKREFYGYEIGGIKLHAAIDVEIRHNRIHDCSLGTWLDWQTQGTRVSRNIYYNNNRDLFVEVSHGPYLVEHNIFGSSASLELFSQGGYAVIYGGDDRFVGNIFLDGDAALAYGPAAEGKAPAGYGTAGYNGHPASFEEYLARIDEQPQGDHQRFIGVKQPVYIRENVYAAKAHAFEGECNPLLLDEAATAVLVDEGNEVYLEAQLPDAFGRATVGVVSGQDLTRVRFVDADFEERDGTPAVMDVDLLGDRKSPGQTYPAGPIAALISGASRVRVW